MSIYDELGLRAMINAAGTYTHVGGSRMSEKTLADMAEAARRHVEIPELQEAVQTRIAEMTGNEASVVCNGAAAGLYLAAVSAVAQKFSKEARYLHREEITESEILSMAAHHIPYDYVLKQLGVRRCRVGYPNIEGSMSTEDLKNAVTEQTVAIFYFASSPYGFHTPGALSLEETIAVGKKHRLPVIVDAAAQLPPAENLRTITARGADAAIFSGGKYLKGPQASGLIVGKKSFLRIIQETNFPHYGFGRMLKLGREEIIGLYSAVKQYRESDHEVQQQFAEDTVRKILESFRSDAVFRMERAFPNEAGQPVPFVRVSVNKPVPLETIVRKMKEGTPSVFIKPEGAYFFLNPMTLKEEEVLPLIQRLKQIESELLEGA